MMNYYSEDVMTATATQAHNKYSIDALKKRNSNTFLKIRKTNPETLVCVACDTTHTKASRVIQYYGEIETNHCPNCGCESYWKL